MTQPDEPEVTYWEYDDEDADGYDDDSPYSYIDTPNPDWDDELSPERVLIPKVVADWHRKLNYRGRHRLWQRLT